MAVRLKPQYRKPRPTSQIEKQEARHKKTRRVAGEPIPKKPTEEQAPVSPRRQYGHQPTSPVEPRPTGPRTIKLDSQKTQRLREIQHQRSKTILSKHQNKGFSYRAKTAGVIGGALGIGVAIGNKEEDDAISTGEKMVKYAGATLAMDYGTQYAAGKLGLNKSLTMGDVSTSQIKAEGKGIMSASEELRWQKSAHRKLGVASVIGLAALGAATFLDISSDLSDNKRASEERNRQEQELEQKMRDEKNQQKKNGYGYVDYGQVVLEQFEKRIGHYAMGNARFY